MFSERGKTRSIGSTAHAARTGWGAKLSSGAQFGSLARRRAWGRAPARSRERRNPRQFDPLTALGGATFFAIMGLSAYGEWLAVEWLIRAIGS